MKTLLTLILLFAMCTLAKSQSAEDAQISKKSEKIASSRDAKRKFVFGLKAGANRSNVFDTEGIGFVAEPKSGFAGGAFAAIPLGGFFGIQPEVLISQKGFTGRGNAPIGRYTLNRTTTFLDVPLQLQLKPFRFFSVVMGVQYSYLLNQNDEYVFEQSVVDQTQYYSNNNIQKNIMGAVGGFDINIRHLVLSGRVGCDIVHNNGDGSSTDPRYRNVWVQATAGFRLY